MPYINKENRNKFYIPTELVSTAVDNEGELNYALTLIICDVIKKWGGNYAAINKAIGVIECMKLELYRRVAAPYENKKIDENGDVYDN